MKQMLTITRLELCLQNEDSELRILLVTLYFILKIIAESKNFYQSF